MWRSVPFLLFMCLLTSCSWLPPYKPVSVKELLPVGSTLRLTRPLVIPANKYHVFIAGGQVKPFKAFNTVDIYKPYCEFKMRAPAPESRTVSPGEFRVTRIIEWEDYRGSLGNWKVAGVDLAEIQIHGGVTVQIGGVFESDGGLSTIMYATILSLESRNHPDVKELVCGHWYDAGKVEPLTLEQFRSALGSLILVTPR